MDTIRKQVPIEEIPESWRDGLGDAEQVVVTLEAVEPVGKGGTCKATVDCAARRRQADEKVIAAVAGLWADRTDVDEFYADLSERRRARFDNPWSED